MSHYECQVPNDTDRRLERGRQVLLSDARSTLDLELSHQANIKSAKETLRKYGNSDDLEKYRSIL